MCRQEIPRDFLEHPNLLKYSNTNEETDIEGGYQWFYEGRNGNLTYLINIYINLKFVYQS